MVISLYNNNQHTCYNSISQNPEHTTKRYHHPQTNKRIMHQSDVPQIFNASKLQTQNASIFTWSSLNKSRLWSFGTTIARDLWVRSTPAPVTVMLNKTWAISESLGISLRICGCCHHFPGVEFASMNGWPSTRSRRTMSVRHFHSENNAADTAAYVSVRRYCFKCAAGKIGGNVLCCAFLWRLSGCINAWCARISTAGVTYLSNFKRAWDRPAYHRQVVGS